MVEAALRDVREERKKRVYLWAFKENHRARRFYEKNGFQTLDLPYFQPPYRSGDACLPMHLMMYGNQGGVADERLKKSVATWVQQMYSEVYKFTPCDEVEKAE